MVKIVISKILCLCLGVMSFFIIQTAKAQTKIDFNSISDLTNKFNPSAGAAMTNVESGGILSTGSVEIPDGVTENWTSKTGMAFSPETEYSVSGYFKVSGNAGRGGLGFSNKDSNETFTYGHPEHSMGIGFHGGGGEFINNSTQTVLSWPPDLIIGNWYFMEYKMTFKAEDSTFSGKFEIFNTDSTGILGDVKTSHTFFGVKNAELEGATKLYPYFCHDGYRMSVMDDFSFNSAGATVGAKNGSAGNLNIDIFPNPSKEAVRISGLKQMTGFEIYNPAGKMVSEGIVSSNEEISIKTLPNGLYFIKLKNGNTLKFIKE